MLVDYDIERSEPKKESLIPFIQFVLIIVFIQCLVYVLPEWMTSSAAEVDGDTLRFRVIANSNSDRDQELKQEILTDIQPLLLQIAYSENQTNLVEVEEAIFKKASAIASANGETVEFGRELALFPPKLVGASLFPQNYYDAYVLTIGSGKGDNFWCALFPNACYPEQKEEEQTEKPKFFIWEWLKDVFS